MGGQSRAAMFAEVYLVYFSDDGKDSLWVVEYYYDSGALLKTEYYKNRQAAYQAAAEVNEKKN